MTYICEMIFASTFVKFSSPWWTLLLPHTMSCATTTIARGAASTKLLEMATPAESRCDITAACLVIMPRVAPPAAIPIADTTAGHRFILYHCSLQCTPIFNQFCQRNIWHPICWTYSISVTLEPALLAGCSIW